MRAFSQLDNNYQHFMEPECLLPCSQRSVICRCYYAKELFHTFLRCSHENSCIISTHPSLYLLGWFLSRGFLKKLRVKYKVQIFS